jgi:hypothetical protein
MVPLAKSIASARLVLPAPAGPASAMALIPLDVVVTLASSCVEGAPPGDSSALWRYQDAAPVLRSNQAKTFLSEQFR